MVRQTHQHFYWPVLVAALLVIPLATGSFADTPEPAAVATDVFSHEGHADALDMTACSACHASTKSAKPAPTTRSHAPCLASGCHIDQFLSTGPRSKKEDPAAYKAAASFCSICHKSQDGSPPDRFAKAPADALFENKEKANYHVEMDHQAHTELTSCSTCHVVDPTSFKLVRAPNHTECRSCHEDSEQPMTNCSSCHATPGPAEYFTQTRKASDVRVCETTEDPKRPCFKHERTEHRFKKESVPLECSSCHFMFKKKKHGGKSYQSLADVKAAPMIDNVKDLAHKNCGSSGCHKREVDDSMGTGKCGQCHSQKFVGSSLFD